MRRKGNATSKTRRLPLNFEIIAHLLSERFGDHAHGNLKNPLNELIFILGSVKTPEHAYVPTYRTLRREFPRMHTLASASVRQIARIIEKAGLSNHKAVYIKGITARLTEVFGKPTLATLRAAGDSECEAFLTSLPGVGKKVARCVMMYSLGRRVFPVDVHCWRISRRIGWICPSSGGNACSPSDMDRLQAVIPPELRFSLHVNMVSLGREVCRPVQPLCMECVIRQHCRRIGVRETRAGQISKPINNDKTRKRLKS